MLVMRRVQLSSESQGESLFVVQQKIPRASVLTCMSSEMVGQLLLLIEVLRGLFKLRNVRTCEISCFLLPTCKALLPSWRSFRSTIRPRYLHVILKMQKP